MDDRSIVLFAAFRARPGRARELQEELLCLSEVSLREPGCGGYAVHAQIDDESTVWLYENWASQKALAEHDRTEHVASFLAKLPDLAEDGFQRWQTTLLSRT